MTDSRHDPYTDPMEDYAGGPVVGNDGNFLADVDDDDAQILDSLVEQDATPPTGEDLPVVRIDMRPIPKDAPPAPVRMVTRTINVPAKDIPFLICSANPYRTRIIIEQGGASTAALDYRFRYAATSTEATNSITSYTSTFPAYTSFELEYNGELWASAVNPTEGLTVSIIELISQETGR